TLHAFFQCFWFHVVKQNIETGLCKYLGDSCPHLAGTNDHHFFYRHVYLLLIYENIYILSNKVGFRTGRSLGPIDNQSSKRRLRNIPDANNQSSFGTSIKIASP